MVVTAGTLKPTPIMPPREMMGRTATMGGGVTVAAMAVSERATAVSVPDRAVICTGPAVAESVTVIEASNGGGGIAQKAPRAGSGNGGDGAGG